MIYDSDIASLISKWEIRLKETSNVRDYKDALSECINELHEVLEDSIIEEAESWFKNRTPEELEDYFCSMEADNYNSTIEAHERTA